ncbi:MAG: ABC transporter ATP-binding protein [Flavobacteriaceae bacterium]|nr:ABC transporter ATP-binding protein [Flavobacteriaceae bacterium]
MIKIEHLTKIYSGKTVLNIPNLEIEQGSCFGLVGNNGAGKTTLFSLLLDLVEPTSGEILNQGIKVYKDESWKAKTSAFIDSTFIIGYLTPEEYFEFIAELRGVAKEELNDWLENFSSFFKDEVLNQKKYIRDLSKGNQKKVGITASFIGSPELVVLDEPFSNLDPSSQIILKKLIENFYKNQNTTFLISSHDLSHVTEVCNRIVLLEKGVVIKDIETNKATLKELEGYFTI